MSNIIAIVGRPNVGKSTLFNRLTESRAAIVDQFSGVTRDRHYGRSEWNGVEFSVIDTGGYITNSEDIFEAEIRKQVDLAISEADVVLFMVDVTTGITDLDQAVTNKLRKSGKKSFIVVNKVDDSMRHNDVHEFYALGYDALYPISSTNGAGTGELLDDVVKHLNIEEKIDNPDIPRFAIVGKPNVGKSSLLNTLIGEERNIVTDIAGTTRDTIDVHYNAFGFDFILVDTAGLRKKGKVQDDLEFYSVLRSVRAIEDCDVAFLMIDANDGITAQDMNIIHLIIKNKKGMVLLVNKWDLVSKETNTQKQFEKDVKAKTAPFTDFPIVTTSVTEKQRIHKALEVGLQVYQNRKQKIKTSKLNEIMLKEIERYPPPATKGKYIRIKYVTQLSRAYPIIAFFANFPQYVKEPYRRYLENKLRDHFDFNGVPLTLYFRKK